MIEFPSKWFGGISFGLWDSLMIVVFCKDDFHLFYLFLFLFFEKHGKVVFTKDNFRLKILLNVVFFKDDF